MRCSSFSGLRTNERVKRRAGSLEKLPYPPRPFAIRSVIIKCGRTTPMPSRIPSLSAVWLFVAAAPLIWGDEKHAGPTYTDHSRLMVYRDADNNEHPVRTRDDWLKRRAHIL